MYFDELALSDQVLDALWDMHFDTCTPVQEQTIPVILDGHDVISCAQTGTGKTAAYILPLLTNLEYDNHDPNKLNAIIMAPTRELAQQIDQQMEGFGFYVPFSSVAIYGGNNSGAWGTQVTGLQKGADIVIATPGRLLSQMNIYDIDFSGVKYFILDEADRMLDMGFYDDIMNIVNKLPKDRQTIMFSATMPANIRKMAKAIMHNPVEVQIAISRPPERTILDKGAEGLDQAALFAAFCVDIGVLIAADGDFLDHEQEADKANDTHDQSGKEYLFTLQDFNLAAGQGAQNLVAEIVSFAGNGVGKELFSSECGFSTFGNLNLIQEPGGGCGIEGNLIPDQHGQQNHGQNVAEHAANRTEYGQRCSLFVIVGNQIQHGTVRNVCEGVSSIPNDVPENEQNCLNDGVGIGERKEYGCAANQQTNGAK